MQTSLAEAERSARHAGKKIDFFTVQASHQLSALLITHPLLNHTPFKVPREAPLAGERTSESALRAFSISMATRTDRESVLALALPSLK